MQRACKAAACLTVLLVAALIPHTIASTVPGSCCLPDAAQTCRSASWLDLATASATVPRLLAERHDHVDTAAASNVPPFACAASTAKQSISQAPVAASRGEASQTSLQGGRFIVRLHGYKPSHQHRQTLTGALGPEGQRWRWVDRHNAASAFPTDFALLEIADSELPAARRTLLASAAVRGVSADKHYQGSREWVPQGPLKSAFVDGHAAAQAAATGHHLASSHAAAAKHASAVGPQRSAEAGPASSLHLLAAGRPGSGEAGHIHIENGGAEQQSADSTANPPAEDGDEDPFAVRMQPGRRRTRFSEEVHEALGDFFNTSADSAGRELLARNLLAPTLAPHVLQAPSIWQQGFTGQGVKVRRSGLAAGRQQIMQRNMGCAVALTAALVL